MTGKTLLRVLLLCVTCEMLHAQNDVLYAPQAESAFLLGVRQFVQQDYVNAYETLMKAAEIKPMHQRTTAAIIMAAKSANAAGRYQEAADLCRTFLEQYAYSSYVEDAQYTLGTAYAGMDRMRDAADAMLAAARIAQVDATRWRAYAAFERYAAEFTPNVLRTLESQAGNDSSRVLLMIMRGEAYARRGEKDSAAAAATNVIGTTADRRMLRRAQHLLMREPAAAAAGDTLTIGVLLPLMNHYRVQTLEGVTAREVLRGMREALRDRTADAQRDPLPVRFDVRDSQRETERTARIIDEWRSDSSLIAILGPLYTDETAAAAAKANEARIPLMSPTATGNDIASIGEYVFQANPDYTMRGMLMAQYAVRIAGALNLAVLTSDAFPSALLADAFVKEAARLGATIVSVQRYSSGTSDFRHLFRAIKTDASKIKGGSLNAIYCPIASPAEIGVVASQTYMFNSNTLILGSDEWNDDEELDRNKTSADGVIFSSDRWVSDPSLPISGLSFESFGYDAAALLLGCIGNASNTRPALRSMLARVREFDGIHSKITFQPARVNGCIHILQYKKGFIKKIGEVTYQE